MTNQEAIAVIKKNPISVACAVVCVAVAATLYFRSDEIPTREAELQQKSTEGERHALNLNNAKELKEQHEAAVTANKVIDSRLLRPTALAANSEFFYKIESATGVKLVAEPRQGQTVAPKGAAKFATIGFTVTAQGDLGQLINFLHHLESGEHYVRIMNASLALTGGKRDGPLTLNLTLELLGLP